MNNSSQSPSLSEDVLAGAILRNAGMNPLNAAMHILHINQACKENNLNDFTKVNTIIKLGLDAHKQQRRSISFAKAVELSLFVKQHRRPRTRQDIRTITNRLFRFFPNLRNKKVRSIKSSDCRRYLEEAFPTPRQFAKARLILSGIFSVCVLHNYTATNPIAHIPAPVVKEKEVPVLSLHQVKTLSTTACKQQHAACLAAMALMIYAGIRPKEVERLTWADIDLADRVIRIRPAHSKTGGTRHVSIQKPLYRILKAMMPEDKSKKICPPNWTARWRRLRKDAGWNSQTNPWQQDCLRHTFATYHIKHFRDYKALQYEMGHRSSDLLRTRYINLGTITQIHAQCFWKQCLRVV